MQAAKEILYQNIVHFIQTAAIFKLSKYLERKEPLYQPGNWDSGIMVSIPAHLEAKGRLQGNILTGQTERDERRGGVREGHPQSVHLPERRKHKNKVKQKLQVQLQLFYTHKSAVRMLQLDAI